jgi:galactose-1-phosphate uridylyltransferase
MTNEEKVMLSSALVAIGRNIEALLPTTMKYALVITFTDDPPHVIYSGELTSKAMAHALRAAADKVDPVVVPIRKDKK